MFRILSAAMASRRNIAETISLGDIVQFRCDDISMTVTEFHRNNTCLGCALQKKKTGTQEGENIVFHERHDD